MSHLNFDELFGGVRLMFFLVTLDPLSPPRSSIQIQALILFLLIFRPSLCLPTRDKYTIAVKYVQNSNYSNHRGVYLCKNMAKYHVWQKRMIERG